MELLFIDVLSGVLEGWLLCTDYFKGHFGFANYIQFN